MTPVTRGKPPAMTWVESHPSGDLLALATGDGDVAIWSLQRRHALQQMKHDAWIVNARWSSDGQWLVVAEVSGKLTLYSQDGTPRHSVDSGHRELRSIAFHPRAPLLVSGGSAGKAIVWEVASGLQESYRIPAPDTPAVTAVALAEEAVLLGFEDGFFEARIDQGRKVRAGGQIFGSGRVASIAVAPDRQLAFFGGGKGGIELVGTDDWKGHEGWNEPPSPISVNQIAFHPSGVRWVAACSHGAALLGGYGSSVVEALGRPFYEGNRQTPWSEKMIVASACFDRSKPRIFVARFEGRIEVWDVQGSLQTRVARLSRVGEEWIWQDD